MLGAMELTARLATADTTRIQEAATQAWFATAVNYARRCFITLETALSEQWVEDKNTKLKNGAQEENFQGQKLQRAEMVGR